MSEREKPKTKSKEKDSSKEHRDKEKDKDRDKDKESVKEKKMSSKDDKKTKKKDDDKESRKKSTIDANELLMNENLNLEKNLYPPRYDPYSGQSSKFQMTNEKRPMNDSSEGEKCDGCYDGEGICFCVNCEKIFCHLCEEQIHIVPINRQHERVPITDIYHLKKLCYHHNNPLKFYCESCEEPVCHECQMMGPHNNKLHRVSNIFESFRKKFAYINNLVQKSLVSKLDSLTNQIGEIEYHIETVKNTKYDIEREIRAEYSEMIENLRSEEGKKLAILQYDSAILQKEINKIQDIVHVVNDIGFCDSPDMIAFLLRYKQLNETVELTLARPFKKSVDVNTEDFPRDLDDRKAKLELLEKLKSLLKAKDDIIWNLICERKDREEKEMKLLKEKTHNEISEWAKLSDKYAMELKKYHLVCHFCGCFLSEDSVNSLCSQNVTSVSEKQSNTTKIVKSENGNTSRHVFGTPNKEFEDKLKKDKNEKIEKNEKSEKKTTPAEKTKPLDESLKNPFEKNILNEMKLSSRSSSPSGNMRYSDDSFKENYENNLFFIEAPPGIVEKLSNNEELILKGADITILCTKDKSYELKYLETSNTFLLLKDEVPASETKKQISLMTNHTLECQDYNPKKYTVINILRRECSLIYEHKTGENNFNFFENKYTLDQLFSISELSLNEFNSMMEKFGIFEKNGYACVFEETSLYSIIDDLLVFMSKEKINYDKIILNEVFSYKLADINPFYNLLLPQLSNDEKSVILKTIFDIYFDDGDFYYKLNIEKLKLFCAKNIFNIKKEANFRLDDFISLLKNMLIVILPYDIIDKLTLENLDFCQSGAPDNILDGFKDYDLRFLKGYSVIYFLKTQREALIK